MSLLAAILSLNIGGFNINVESLPMVGRGGGGSTQAAAPASALSPLMSNPPQQKSKLDVYELCAPCRIDQTPDRSVNCGLVVVKRAPRRPHTQRGRLE